MSPVLWLTFPLGATLLTLVVVYFINRPRKPAGMHETMESFERFRVAADRVSHQGAGGPNAKIAAGKATPSRDSADHGAP